MPSDTPLSILGLSGSLRTGSYNRSILRACMGLVPEGMELHDYDYSDVPLYNGDVEALGMPPSALALKTQIEAADGVLIVTPEYNRGMPGVLKNALDWASRPPPGTLARKPIAVTGASPGWQGALRAQEQVKQFAIHLNMYLLPQPEVHIGEVRTKLDDNGNLIDERTREHLQGLLKTFGEFIRHFKGVDPV